MKMSPLNTSMGNLSIHFSRDLDAKLLQYWLMPLIRKTQPDLNVTGHGAKRLISLLKLGCQDKFFSPYEGDSPVCLERKAKANARLEEEAFNTA